MKRFAMMAMAFVASAAFVMTALSQPPEGGKGGKGGPGKEGKEGKGFGKGFGKEGNGPPRFELGRVLPPFAMGELNLTKDQEDKIAELEKQVKAKLESILTPEQRKMLENMRPMGGQGGPGGGFGGKGGPGGPGGGFGGKGGKGGGPGGPGGPGGKGPGGPGGPPPGGPGGPPPGEQASEAPMPRIVTTIGDISSAAGIQWFATWESGRFEAERTGRPILLLSAAPHCAGVSGIW